MFYNQPNTLSAVIKSKDTRTERHSTAVLTLEQQNLPLGNTAEVKSKPTQYVQHGTSRHRTYFLWNLAHKSLTYP